MCSLFVLLVSCAPPAPSRGRGDGGTSPQDASRGDAAREPDWNERPPTDTDADFLSDDQEGPSASDWDRDGTPDYLDADTDGDGISDRDEAGDTDLGTPPLNSDGDSLPDFRDTDSDNDGLSDHEEVELGTSPTNDNTDGDGVPDFVEVEACRRSGATDCLGDARAADRSPAGRGNFYFFEPWMDAPSPSSDALAFGTALRRADIYFLMDTTSSMGGEIRNLQNGLVDERTGIMAGIRAQISEARFGLGYYRDYPGWFSGNPEGTAFWQSGDAGHPPFRERPADVPYGHLVSVVSTVDGRFATADENATEVAAAVRGLSAFQGGDGPESAAPAIFAALTGNSLSWPNGDFGPSREYSAGTVPARTGCPEGTWGYPCFRNDAVPILVNITDAPSHNGPNDRNDYRPPPAIRGFSAPTYAQTMSALAARGAFVVGVSSDDISLMHTGTPDLRAMAQATGAVVEGAPLVFEVDGEGNGLSTRIVDGIAALAGALPLDIAIEYVEEPGGHTQDDFVMSITPNTAGVPGMCAPHASVRDGMFLAVPAGRRVCFDIRPKENTTVPQIVDRTQVFTATLRVVGISGATRTPLDSRQIFFLVPPSVRQAPGPG